MLMAFLLGIRDALTDPASDFGVSFDDLAHDDAYDCGRRIGLYIRSIA